MSEPTELERSIVRERKEMQTERELRLLLALSRRLPAVRGSGRLGGLLARLYNRKPRAELIADVLGHRMRVDPHECLGSQLLFCPHLYEYKEMAHLRRLLKAGDAFLDAGANIGFYSLVASRLVQSSGSVLAVEAEPENFHRLQSNIELNGYKNILSRNIGLWDKPGVLRLGLNLTGNPGGHSFLAQGDGGVNLPCQPLLAVIQESGLARLDVAKFDIEGCEFRVLKAFFLEAPQSMRPRAIIFEQNTELTSRAAGSAIALLCEQGYAVSKIKDQDYLALRR